MTGLDGDNSAEAPPSLPSEVNPAAAPEDAEPPKRALLETLVTSAAGTQEELADELGISYATLHAWKTGRRDVPDGALEAMARIALRRSRTLHETGSRLLWMVEARQPGGGRLVGGHAPSSSADARSRVHLVRDRVKGAPGPADD